MPLKYIKLVEKDFREKCAGMSVLPKDVVATGAPSTPAEKNDLIQCFDQNWNPSLGYPNFKVRRSYYFGGMKKKLKIPLSMPNRVIIEPNPPRQGYSHLTWNTLNEYYLQQCMTQDHYK